MLLFTQDYYYPFSDFASEEIVESRIASWSFASRTLFFFLIQRDGF